MDSARVTELTRELLLALGQDPDREGLRDTPLRVAQWWRDFFSQSSATNSASFAETDLGGQLIVVGNMSVWSLCEHHLLPMHLEVCVGYVPNGRVLGLSKFGRIARQCASRLQVQERFTSQVLRAVSEATGSEHVAAVVRGEHLCMSMRGVRMESAQTTTVLSQGRLETDPTLSQRFLAFTGPSTMGRRQ
ncbi:GTP cyclohydrolase I [Nocardiopsis sp. HUAS JQ3]|uniref:GTP cyclohydrolase I n=1 Tax=Nocardiopsis sp. HUAS JQ3 TaxID=3061629 RepID=UPI0023A979FA|nr:GTP cyclohydrolase I [Nocardiopsis sp. HUAS JQ3]WDZ90594.1 GTP cyclohydrolase I [Nocardiopsis sp. HUAS JQ3]